ncbi:TFIIB-type zinc ribbon-containing protein [Gulosibacter sp. 10]|uniref:TFIIB-type zinc ribbon-containing protein n=1 Tax=Gulosibacter sp. 10 TaxID=1255570 RepID=UPI0020CBA77C|nr:TFIIB-type zinc ribbon-containing protein [Gulosibacter sp. 10]
MSGSQQSHPAQGNGQQGFPQAAPAGQYAPGGQPGAPAGPVTQPGGAPQGMPGQHPPQGVPGQHPGPGERSGEQRPGEAAPPAGGPGIKVTDTSAKKRDGLDKCPKCGSTEVVPRPSSGTLICQFCRYEWAEATIEETFGFDSPINQLRGIHMGSGATRIQESTEDVVTLKCQACGADVVVNTAEATQSRCHWCRNTLSINRQMPNGAVPDGLLPFSITKEQAVENIREFVGARKFFANPKFVHEFAPEEVVGVYMPYLAMDANASVDLRGQGEIQTRSYMRGTDKNRYRVYDADVYELGRKFDIAVDDVLIESSGERANQDVKLNTNNVINAIQPFDTKKAVSYNANYLRGFTSERRDLDVAAVEPMANGRVLSIARSRAGETIRRYDRGVRWRNEELVVHGSRWVSLYVPVWLYSYFEVKNGQAFTHYVAVNGRTGATMGSVPVHKARLIGVSTLISILGTAASAAIAFAVLFT